MNHHLHQNSLLSLLCGLACLGSMGRAIAADPADVLETAGTVLEADRQAVVARTLQLDASEGARFWPLYHQYRAAMDEVEAELLRLIAEYATLYPDVPEKPAQNMLKEWINLEDDYAATRAKYVKKAVKAIGATKALRFAQVENRLALGFRLQLASQVPIVPIEGQIAGMESETVVTAEGVAGGIRVRTFTLNATVAAINPTNRTVTLVNEDGIKQTVKAGPEVINFEQIRVGDQLKVTATQQLVVSLAGPDETGADSVTNAVLLAPPGSRPGGVLAETTRMIGRVLKLDREKRLVTLLFADGTQTTFLVRADVDLSRRRVGEQVSFELTETIAMAIESP